MNRLALERRAPILGLLTEGNSMRATSRIAGVSINTVTKLGAPGVIVGDSGLLTSGRFVA